MALTPQQLAALKADILADPTLSAYPMDSDGAFAIAAVYNTPTAAFYAWRTSISADALRIAALNGAAEMDNLEAGKRDALFWMLAGTVNPSLAPTRQAFLDLTANRTGGFVATALRAALSSAGKRTCNRIEKLLATGTGTEGSPATMTFEGSITYTDVIEARQLP